MVLLRVVAAFWAATNTDEKNPPLFTKLPEELREPAGVLDSSIVGVRGADIEFESLLGR